MVADKKKWLAKIQQYVNQKKQKLAYSEWYFCGNFKHNDRIASTTTILNSSAISDIKLVICFIKRSTLASLPVFNSVVIASVAMLLFWSKIKLSMSMLQFVTAKGYVIATCKGCPNKKTQSFEWTTHEEKQEFLRRFWREWRIISKKTYMK